MLKKINEFPILDEKIDGKRLVYLDSAATTQKPQMVLDAILNFYKTQNANVHRGMHELGNRATEAYENARKVIAEFLNANQEEIVFTKGTTDSINIIAGMLKQEIQEGDEIVLTEYEHHSNIIPWQQLAKEKNARLRYIPITKEYTIDLKKAEEIISDRTKIVSIGHVSNVLGLIAPIKELEKLAHKNKAVFIIDAAQSVSHLEVDVKKLNVDFLACSGHKMCGPTGIGVLYGKKELLEKYNPVAFGGSMIREVTREWSTWADIPQKFEAGTPNIEGAVGLAAAIQYLQSKEVKKKRQEEKKLTAYTLKKLQAIKGLKIIGPTTLSHRIGVFSFTVQGVHPHDVAEILNKEGIAVRAGHHCAMPLHKKLNIEGTTRISLYIYNTKEDIDAAIKAIHKVQEVFK